MTSRASNACKRIVIYFTIVALATGGILFLTLYLPPAIPSVVRLSKTYISKLFEDPSSAETSGETMASLNSIRAQLTSQQKKVLEAILFSLKNGELPTVREVGSLVGLRSPATVLKHLRALQNAGLITLNGKSRGIRIASKQLLEETLNESSKAASNAKEANVRKSATPPSRTAFPGLKVTPTGRILGAHLPRLREMQPPPSSRGPSSSRGVPLLGAIAAGRPFESYPDAFAPDGFGEAGFYHEGPSQPLLEADEAIPIDPNMFVESGEVFALRVDGNSMINAGILDGDYVIIRRQNAVEDGEIAAVLINGEGTLKRWRIEAAQDPGGRNKKKVTLLPANDGFEPIEISEEDGKDVLVIGKYVGLVRGNLRLL